MIDLLSDVLKDLRLESAVLSVSELRAPWGIEKTKVQVAPFHVVLEGRCFFRFEDEKPVELAAGDLIVLPRGCRHSLASTQKTQLTPFSQVLEANGINPRWRPGMPIGLAQVRFGGNGELTRVLNGVFAFRDHRHNPLVAALPSVIHVRGRLGRPAAWLEGSLGLLIDEMTSIRPGFQTIVERLADIIFIQAVRDQIRGDGEPSRGWLRGLADVRIARALALMHSRPQDSWTVASIGRTVGLSRTAFSNRFSDLVGSTVMGYLAQHRMHVAAGLLVTSSEPVAVIAENVGYQSEISFSKAFRRWAGVPPGQYRRTGRQGTLGPADSAEEHAQAESR